MKSPWAKIRLENHTLWQVLQLLEIHELERLKSREYTREEPARASVLDMIDRRIATMKLTEEVNRVATGADNA